MVTSQIPGGGSFISLHGRVRTLVIQGEASRRTARGSERFNACSVEASDLFAMEAYWVLCSLLPSPVVSSHSRKGDVVELQACMAISVLTSE